MRPEGVEKMGKRYLRKMRFLNHTPGLCQERMDDLLRRVKVDLPLLKKWLLDAREREIEVVFRGNGFEAAHAQTRLSRKACLISSTVRPMRMLAPTV